MAEGFGDSSQPVAQPEDEVTEVQPENRVEIETQRLSVEDFSEMVWKNGRLINSHLNTPGFPAYETYKNVDQAQLVYLFNNQLYLVEFDITCKIDRRKLYTVDKMSPKNCIKLEADIKADEVQG